MIYKDDFGNTAKIERVKLFAYCGATEKEKGSFEHGEAEN